MRRAVGIFCLGAGLVLLTGRGVVHAQEAVEENPGSRSHIPIPQMGGPLDMQKLFEERLRQVEARNRNSKLPSNLAKLLSQKDVAKLVDALKDKIDPNDPLFKDQVQKALRDQNLNDLPMKLSPKDLDWLKGTLKKAIDTGKLPDMPPMGPGGNTKQPPDSVKVQPPQPPPDGLPPDNSMENLPPPDLQLEEDRAETREMIMESVRQAENLARKLDDSPEMQQAVREITRAVLDMQSPNLPPQDRLDNQLAALNRHARDVNGWFKDSWKSMGKMKLPKLPNMPKMPRLDWQPPEMPQVGGLPNVDLPQMRAPSELPDPASAGRGLLLVIGTCLLLVVLWKLGGSWWRERSAERAGWQLGPWPIHPSRVASAQDLIRAFEYLSLLRLGYAARHWNHRDIAGRLGAFALEHARAAASLADMYEQARYAPDEEALPADAVAAARRDLCLLAGMARV